MKREDFISLTLAYLSIPIALLILNTDPPTGLFIHNESVILLGNIFWGIFMILGVIVIPSILLLFLINNKISQEIYP